MSKFNKEDFKRGSYTYNKDRSLCWNIAAKYNIREDVIREMVNAKTHLKDIVVNPQFTQVYDILTNDDTVVIVSNINTKGSDDPEYMVAVGNATVALDINANWIAGNAIYTKDALEALRKVTEAMGGEMKYW